MRVDSDEPEDWSHKKFYPSCRARHRDIKGKKDTEGKAENQQKTKHGKLPPKPFLKYLRRLKKADDGKHCYKRSNGHFA